MIEHDLPALVALFLVVFDRKIGYSITWQQYSDEISLEGVEYQSLPSGLHEIDEDIIYFTKDDHIGLSAYQQVAAESEHRNAHFLAVGALLKTGDDGSQQAWRYAKTLKDLTVSITHDLDDTTPLETFWKEHNIDKHPLQDDKQPSRSIADIASPDHHPFLTMALMLRLFGPLIFPLQRAAMLGKRILFLGRPPVKQACDMVHILSTLSKTSEKYPPESQPLYSVGVTDLDRLSTSQAWIACTTDTILAEKKQLYDMLVELPANDAWPILRASSGSQIRASQRDLRRYERLDRFLQQSLEQETDEHAKLLRAGPFVASLTSSALIEAQSWSEMAYISFMWWSSAGEQAEWLADEEDFDNDLLQEYQSEMSVAMTTITFSQRLSAHILKVVRDAVTQLEQSDQSDGISIPVEILQQAGLDPWSRLDREFVVELTGANAKHKVQIADDGLTICGIRVC